MLNKEWHLANVLGQGAPMERRIEWHLAHAAACGCRPIPRTVQEAIAARAASAAGDPDPAADPAPDPVSPGRRPRGPGPTAAG